MFVNEKKPTGKGTELIGDPKRIELVRPGHAVSRRESDEECRLYSCACYHGD